MNWSDIAGLVGKAAPILGTLLGGPAGAAIGGLVSSALGVENTPDAIHAAVQNDPQAAVKLAQIEADNRVQLQALTVTSEQNRLAAETAGTQAVNATMQTEAKSDHWPTYTWRPFIGFMFGSYVASLWLLPLFHVQPVQLDPTIAMAVGGILGVASWFRGKMQADPNIPTDNRG